MKFLLLSLLLSPFNLLAQDSLPKYQNDTVYTSSGYKIFNGQVLEFAKGTMRDGRFRYVNSKNFLSITLTNSTVVVNKITKYSTSALGNSYVDLIGYITLKDGSKEIIILHMAFDRLIENSPVLLSELKVPDEFRNTRPRNIHKELTTARNLYEDRVIKKAEYESMKNELLKQ